MPAPVEPPESRPKETGNGRPVSPRSLVIAAATFVMASVAIGLAVGRTGNTPGRDGVPLAAVPVAAPAQAAVSAPAPQPDPREAERTKSLSDFDALFERVKEGLKTY